MLITKDVDRVTTFVMNRDYYAAFLTDIQGRGFTVRITDETQHTITGVLIPVEREEYDVKG